MLSPRALVRRNPARAKFAAENCIPLWRIHCQRYRYPYKRTVIISKHMMIKCCHFPVVSFLGLKQMALRDMSMSDWMRPLIPGGDKERHQAEASSDEHRDEIDISFADDIFKRISFNENVWMSIIISLSFVPKGPNKNIPALVQKMAWRRPGDKPLYEAMISLQTHICVTRPQWIKFLSFRVSRKLLVYRPIGYWSMNIIM